MCFLSIKDGRKCGSYHVSVDIGNEAVDIIVRLYVPEHQVY